MSTEEEKLQNAIKNVELFFKDRREPREIFLLLDNEKIDSNLLNSLFSDMYHESNTNFEKFKRFFLTSSNELLLNKVKERIDDIISYYGTKVYDNQKENFRNTLIVLLLEKCKLKTLDENEKIDIIDLLKLNKIISEMEQGEEEENIREINNMKIRVLAKNFKDEVYTKFKTFLENPSQLSIIEDEIESGKISSTAVTRHASVNYQQDNDYDDDESLETGVVATGMDIPIKDSGQLYSKILEILMEYREPIEERPTEIASSADSSIEVDNYKELINKLVEQLLEYNLEILTKMKNVLQQEFQMLNTEGDEDIPREAITSIDVIYMPTILHICLLLIEYSQQMRSMGGKTRKNKRKHNKTKNGKKYLKKSKKSKKNKIYKKNKKTCIRKWKNIRNIKK